MQSVYCVLAACIAINGARTTSSVVAELLLSRSLQGEEGRGKQRGSASLDI